MKQQIEEFMKCTGNDSPSFDNIDKERLLNKISKLTALLSEEVQELIDGLVAKSVVECVDAVGDIGVYYYQLVSLLERAGVNYSGACDAICTNNSLKFTTSTELAEKWLLELQEQGNFQCYISGTEVDNVVYYCIKDLKTHKVKKHIDFPQVSLKEFIPEKYLNEEVK